MDFISYMALFKVYVKFCFERFPFDIAHDKIKTQI